MTAGKSICLASLFCTLAFISVSAQNTFSTLLQFTGANGATPSAVLVQGTNGAFYGTTQVGSTGCVPNGCGTVFKITPDGIFNKLHTFNSKDGSVPTAGVIQGSQGNFYGTTSTGGLFGSGTVFRMAPGGGITTLYSFCGQSGCSDGSNPTGELVQGKNGNFYGMTSLRGAFDAGTVFRITPAGLLTTLYSFCAQSLCADGSSPRGALIQGADGNFYGMTSSGGAHGGGTVFRISSAGTLVTIYNFCAQPGCSDGATPLAGLVQGNQGNFYGTTSAGGNSSCNPTNGCGTVFRITMGGALTTLYTFCVQNNCSNGSAPASGLTRGTDGKFYGTTSAGGANNDGTIFRITAAGVLTKLHSFNGTDGKDPVAALLQGTNGKFYGTTSQGGFGCGTTGCGTVFSLDVGLGPFIETRPNSGTVGTSVIILGNGLTGTTAVTFNGTTAEFIVISDSEITTTVPDGATTGAVQATTPSGILSSNNSFQVTQ